MTHALGLALAAGPERWTAMEGGVPILAGGECIGGVGVSGGDWQTDLRSRRPRSSRSARAGSDGFDPLRVACIGMGWWSDVLADAMKRSDKIKIVACFTRSEDKRAAFAKKYGCKPIASYEAVLADPEIEAIVNTTPNDVHLPTTRAAAAAGKHVFLDKPIANNVTEGRAITEVCRKAGVVLAMGYQRRRESHFRWIKQQIDAGVFGKLVNAEANISRDRLGKIDLTSWRYQAAGMPGGVMLQIGIHYTDVLTYLMGPVKAVRGQFAQLVLPGDNPDVASLILEHDSGALSTLNASYASASEYYLMNIYGKDATAYYDMHGGLRLLKRGEDKPVAVPVTKNDTFVEELEEFAAAIRGSGKPEVGGDYATTSLAVVRAGILSAREGRRVEVAEILEERLIGRMAMTSAMRIATAVAVGLFGALPAAGNAQAYPTRTITVVVPFPAGGPSDVVARIVAEQIGRTLGQTLVIENVGGAGGTIGSGRVAAAAPDGYTLLAGSMGSHVAAPVLTPNIKYDPARDFIPIGPTAHSPAVIVARKDFPAKNLREFVALTQIKGATVSSRPTAASARRRTWRACCSPRRSAPSRRRSPIAAPARR